MNTCVIEEDQKELLRQLESEYEDLLYEMEHYVPPLHRTFETIERQFELFCHMCGCIVHRKIAREKSTCKKCTRKKQIEYNKRMYHKKKGLDK